MPVNARVKQSWKQAKIMWDSTTKPSNIQQNTSKYCIGYRFVEQGNDLL